MKNRIQILLILFPLFVLGQNPNWQVNSALYNLDASLIVRLKVGDGFLADRNDQVAAFDSKGIIKGVANLIENGSTGEYFAFLTVLSNTQNEAISFKIYDQSTDVIVDVNERYTFQGSDTVGLVTQPFVLTSDAPLGLEKVEIKGFSYQLNHDKNTLVVTANEVLGSLQLVSTSGQLLINNNKLGKQIVTDVSQLTVGTYIILVTSGNKVKSIKFVK